MFLGTRILRLPDLPGVQSILPLQASEIQMTMQDAM